ALADQAWVPSPLSLVKQFDAVTGLFAYVRLLGDRAEVDKLTDKLDRIVIDREEQIRDDAQAIKLLSERVPVLAFVNNDFAGYAPETIRQLLDVLGREGDACPTRCLGGGRCDSNLVTTKRFREFSEE